MCPQVVKVVGKREREKKNCKENTHTPKRKKKKETHPTFLQGEFERQMIYGMLVFFFLLFLFKANLGTIDNFTGLSPSKKII